MLYSRTLCVIPEIWNPKYGTNELVNVADSHVTFKNSSNCTVESGPWKQRKRQRIVGMHLRSLQEGLMSGTRALMVEAVRKLHPGRTIRACWEIKENAWGKQKHLERWDFSAYVTEWVGANSYVLEECGLWSRKVDNKSSLGLCEVWDSN